MATRNAAERWFSIAKMAGFLGMSVPAFRALHLSMGAPHQVKRGNAKTSPIFINSKRWLQVWRGCGTSRVEDALARLKEAQAGIVELRLGKMAGELVDVEEFGERVLGPWADHIRRGAERLQRISIPAFEEMCRVLDESIADVRRRCAAAEHHSNGHSNGKAKSKSHHRNGATPN